MENLPKIANFFRWLRQNGRLNDDNFRYFTVENYNKSRNLKTSKRLCTVIESILSWDNSVNSVTVMVVFNMLFWSIVVLEVRGFAAASSAALVVVLGRSTLEARIKNEYPSNSTPLQTKTLQICYILHKVKNSFEGVKSLRRDRPGTFCSGMCILSIVLWLMGRTINGVLFTYIICMSILLGPVLLFKIPKNIFLRKAEWDSGIDEFLPAVTVDSLKILERAGDMGDRSPTPPSESSDNQIDPFNDNAFIDSKMPSHEDGSTDGLDIFELELSYGESDVNCLKIQNAHFEGNSSSEEEVELQLNSKDLASNSDDNESDFEIIDGTSNFGNN